MNSIRESVRSPWVTADPRINAQVEAALQAVWAAFPFFERDDILVPGRSHLNGIARHTFQSILNEHFGLSKGLIAAIGHHHINRVREGSRNIERRRAGERFGSWFDAIAADAVSRFKQSEWSDG